MRQFDMVIVGSGHAGAQLAIALRQQKFGGSIAMIGDEPDPPYERPPLSKEFLAGEKSFERMLIRPLVFWTERAIELLLGKSVERVDASARQLRLGDGEMIGFGQLVWAAGGRARTLACEGADLGGVHSVRSRADVERMIAELPAVRQVVVIGGGYIGLETAAVLTKLGKSVVVLEALDRVLARVAGEPLSRFYENEHRAHGVDLRTGAAVERIEGQGGKVSGVRLAGGELLAAQMVVIGVGILPNVEPLAQAGAQCGNGVNVDPHCRTSLDGIFAIGDCAAHQNRFAGGARIRLESVQNANDQAATVVDFLVGAARPYSATPWFWSNQYDLRLQTVGLSLGHDRLLVRGEPASRSFSLVYFRGDRVIALDCVNSTRDFVQGRKAVEQGARIDEQALADPAIPIASLLG